jgi:hypothetical protein
MNQRKINSAIIMFCKSLGWAGGANHKLVFKEVKKNFLKFLNNLPEKDTPIEFLIYVLEKEDMELLFKIDVYFVWLNMSWLNPKKIYYYFFQLPELERLFNLPSFKVYLFGVGFKAGFDKKTK